jgi:hypothetical protein
MAKFSGILPPELVRIVSAYAKPCLRYKKLYEDALKAFGLKRWPQLGRKLFVKNHLLASLLKVLLVAHKNAVLGENMARLLQEQAEQHPDAVQAEQVATSMYSLLKDNYMNARSAVLVAVYDGKRPPLQWNANYV